MNKLRYTPAREAWDFEHPIIEEVYGHRFGPPIVEDFTFVGTKYTATCLACGALLYVSGGWGGPAAYGPATNKACK